jgi:hypothetical protein
MINKDSHTLLKKNGKWQCSALPTRPGNDNTDIDINLTWLWAAVRKYDIGAPGIGFSPRFEKKRYKGLHSLSNGYSCAFIQSMVQEICFSEVAEILRWMDPRETNYFKFWPRFKIKTPKILNTKHVDILLSFPNNICVPYVDKPSNGYGIWEISRGKIFSRI